MKTVTLRLYLTRVAGTYVDVVVPVDQVHSGELLTPRVR